MTKCFEGKVKKHWRRCSRPGSNRWPSPYQSDALPTALRELCSDERRPKKLRTDYLVRLLVALRFQQMNLDLQVLWAVTGSPWPWLGSLALRLGAAPRSGSPWRLSSAIPGQGPLGRQSQVQTLPLLRLHSWWQAPLRRGVTQHPPPKSLEGRRDRPAWPCHQQIRERPEQNRDIIRLFPKSRYGGSLWPKPKNVPARRCQPSLPSLEESLDWHK